MAFYVLAIFCLTSWCVTAMAQTIEPRTRYLVFQLIDDPKYFHITADLSQVSFVALFALVSATVFQID